jgi:hypothetical protein
MRYSEEEIGELCAEDSHEPDRAQDLRPIFARKGKAKGATKKASADGAEAPDDDEGEVRVLSSSPRRMGPRWAAAAHVHRGVVTLAHVVFVSGGGRGSRGGDLHVAKAKCSKPGQGDPVNLTLTHTLTLTLSMDKVT